MTAENPVTRAPLRFLALASAALFALAAGARAAEVEKATEQRAAPGCVVLLHGMARTRMSMRRMAAALEAAGYVTVSVDYWSRAKRIEELAADAVPRGLQRCREARAGTVD